MNEPPEPGIAPICERRTELAHRLADAAAQITRPAFLDPHTRIYDKGQCTYDPVTDADRNAEKAMLHLIQSQVPEDAFCGEETGTSGKPSSGWTWTIDPIDGTRAFVIGSPTWTTLIGMSQREQRVYGLIDQPVTGMRCWGDRHTSWLNGYDGKIRTISTRALPSDAKERRLATTDYFLFDKAGRSAFERLCTQVGLVRYGLDGYAIAMLACGRLDLVIETGLAPHDMEALIPIIEGAGGVVTDWNGNPPGATGNIIAAGDKSGHDLARALLDG